MLGEQLATEMISGSVDCRSIIDSVSINESKCQKMQINQMRNDERNLANVECATSGKEEKCGNIDNRLTAIDQIDFKSTIASSMLSYRSRSMNCSTNSTAKLTNSETIAMNIALKSIESNNNCDYKCRNNNRNKCRSSELKNQSILTNRRIVLLNRFNSNLFHSITRMILLVFLTSRLEFVLSGALSKTVLYQAPDECRWSNTNEHDITLVCHLRTINSELEKTNFSVIQPQNTIRLRLECNDTLFFQSSLSPDSFRSLVELRSLTIEYCKLSNLTEGSFRGLHDLRNLTIRTHNADWSTMSLDMSSNSFREYRQLDRLDLSLNNIWLIPDGMLCPLKVLKHFNISHNEIQDLSNFHFIATASTITSSTATASTATAAAASSSPSSISNNQRKSLRPSCGQTLEEIDLSYNKIANLPTAIFSTLRNLIKLNLSKNGMNFIADRAFEGLVSLNVINLSENRLTSLPPELFAETKFIKEIYLRNNSINVLAPGLFNELHQLLILDLSSNELNSQWVNAATFIGLKQLILLDLSMNKISKLELNIFRTLSSLQILKMEQNYIDHLPDGIFNELHHLHTLILSNNRLSTINAMTFRGLYNLIVLSLDYNRINKIDQYAFKNTTTIQNLHINGNKLHKIPDALSYLPLLKSLDIGENQITTIENTSIILLENLYGLRLTENYIEHIRRGVFDRLITLQILNLSGNKIKTIESGSLQYNIQLQAIRLDNNHLHSIAGLFNDLPNLVWLNISDNRLEKFDYSHIPIGLQWLDVHANRLITLGNYFEIENELSLTTFDASSNLLIELNAASIPNSIEVLYLNDNQINKIQPYTFFKKPNLTRVDLIRNQLLTLEPNALRLSPIPNDRNIPEFYIGQNPFECDCNLDWLQKLNIDSRTQPKLMDLDRIHCKLSYTRNDRRVNIPLIDVKSNEFLCSYETHCFALCHCCDYYACDCKMECPDNCSCHHDQSWTSNIVDCSTANYQLNLPSHIPMDATQLYLDGNNFPQLSSHSFIGRKRLKILHLNHSNIEIIHNRTFYGLLELDILQLNNNKLRQLNGHEFHGLDNLQELYLQYNRIYDIDILTFTHLYHLKILHLEHNNIVNFAIWNYLPPYLNELYLADNYWICNCNFIDKFRDYIDRHEETVVDKYRLRCYKTNQQSQQQNNQSSLGSLSNSTTATAVSTATSTTVTATVTASPLTSSISSTFNVNENEQFILYLNPETLARDLMMKGKRYIICGALGGGIGENMKQHHHNHHAMSSSSSSSSSSSLYGGSRHHHHNNNDNIDQYNEDRLNELLLQHTNGQQFINDNSLSSLAASASASSAASGSSASSSSSTLMTSSTSTKMILKQPPMHDYIPILIAILTGFIFVIIFTLLIFIFRQEMRVWCHSRYGIRIFYNSHKDLDKNEREKLFDAFISYSIKDETFVHEELQPILEHNDDIRYKLCLQSRDFPIGGYIADAIVQAIDTSRRTIMILSENYIKSEWCRFEFKSAHQSVLRDRRKRLIVIVLGEVPQKDLDPDLRLYLKTNTYLQWGDKLFWEKLRFAMPDVPNNQRQQRHRSPHTGHFHGYCAGSGGGGSGRSAIGLSGTNTVHIPITATAPTISPTATNQHHHLHHQQHHHHHASHPLPPLAHNNQNHHHHHLHHHHLPSSHHLHHLHGPPLPAALPQQPPPPPLPTQHIPHGSFRSQMHHNFGGSRQNHNRNGNGGTAAALPPPPPSAAVAAAAVTAAVTAPTSMSGANLLVGGSSGASSSGNGNSIQQQSLPLPPCPSPRTSTNNNGGAVAGNNNSNNSGSNSSNGGTAGNGSGGANSGRAVHI